LTQLEFNSDVVGKKENKKPLTDFTISRIEHITRQTTESEHSRSARKLLFLTHTQREDHKNLLVMTFDRFATHEDEFDNNSKQTFSASTNPKEASFLALELNNA